MGPDVSMAVCCAFPVLVSLLLVRFAYVMYHSGHMPSKLSASAAGMRSLIVLGSGGHTAEMMNVVTTLQKDRFTPRYYVAALTDNMSLQKAQVYEQSLVRVEVDKEESVENAQFVQIYRSREVGQSYITSIATTLLATSHAIWIIIRIRPQVIFCNGPGTCIPLCVSAFLLKVLGLGWSSIFYIESIARVKKLSLSGLLLYKLRIADQFFVQWPQLQQKYPRACYAGRLIKYRLASQDLYRPVC
uniref:UDP-N-acetylglucosamine transferase subunit ALG14 n=1 Tax=Oryza nivara TaxID=4536 RepID=A0A0E0GP73_ORYNI